MPNRTCVCDFGFEDRECSTRTACPVTLTLALSPTLTLTLTPTLTLILVEYFPKMSFLEKNLIKYRKLVTSP